MKKGQFGEFLQKQWKLWKNNFDEIRNEDLEKKGLIFKKRLMIFGRAIFKKLNDFLFLK